jgi:glutaminyl-peptide cyclotransferase
MRNLELFIGVALALFVSCDTKMKDQEAEATGIPLETMDLKFDENLAYSYIEKQVSFGPRVPSTDQHAACAEWIIAEMKGLADTVYMQEFDAVTYDGKKHKGKNILAKLNPSNPNRIQLAAHWDTRPIADQDASNQLSPILGADDAGSGVGIILSLIRTLKEKNVSIGVDIVFFDIEDYGQPQKSGLPPMEHSWCLGSQYWGKNYKELNRPRWGVLLDMAGAKGATFSKEEISMLYAPNLVNRIWNIASGLGYESVFRESIMGTIEDDHLYMNTLAAIPTVDIINYRAEQNRFGDHWHTHRDNLEVIDKKTLKIVGNVLEQLILEEDSIIK